MSATRVLLTGSTGYLGRFLRAELEARSIPFTTLGRTGCDVTVDLEDSGSVREQVARSRATHVLHAGAIAAMAACEADEARAHRVNAGSVEAMLAASPARLVLVSTDLVFDGERAPYDERSAPEPCSAYGRSKAAAERVLRAAGRGLVVRVPLLFGPSFDGRRGATDMIRSAFANRAAVTLFTDEARTPLHVADAARGLVDALLSMREGALHLPGPERVSRAELGLRFCRLHGLPGAALRLAPRPDPSRPRDTSLAGGWSAGRSLDAMLRDS